MVHDIEQGTAKWLQWRRGVIGASEAAIIMGENRWKGRQQLIDEKRGLAVPFSGNAATREGQYLEEFARSALAKKYKEKLFPTIVQDVHEPFLAASLDAINAAKERVYEIKCGARTYDLVKFSRKIPSYYIAQVQHMLMVTQMESLIFAAYRPSQSLVTFEVFRDDRYIRELRRKEKDFVKELVSKGHKIQENFCGDLVGKASSKTKSSTSKPSKNTQKPAWIIEDGLLRFWDGSDYLEGESPGLYDLLGKDQYWNGEEWSLPENVGFYNLNGDDRYWNGKSWE